MISGETRLGTLLDRHPELADFLGSYRSHFARFRRGALRDAIGAMTLAQAAQVAGVGADEFVSAIRRAVGEPAGSEPGAASAPAPSPAGSTARPPALDAIPSEKMVVLDVREDIRRGDEPFARIMMAVKKLADDAALLLRVPFEPVPLYDVLGKRGLAHWTESRAADDWAVYFYRARAASPAPASSPGPPAARAANGATTLDVRDLEPPQPMIQILERLDSLRPGEELVVIHSRRPMLLYPQIEDRGFVHETDEPAPGTVRIRIRHGGGS